MLNSLKKSIQENQHNNAFFINQAFFTYKQLNAQIGSIQNQLKSQLTGSTKIGLITNDDFETYSSILAILFLGYSYVPLSPKTPKDRNTNIIDQANIRILLSSSTDIDKFIDSENLLIINSKEQKFNNSEIEISESSDDDLAYTLFTSGSTGIPKGVAISRKNINSFIDSFFALDIKISNKDRVLQMFELTFDVSVACILLPLMVGACIYTVPTNEVKYTYIYSLLEEQQITFATLVPSVLAYLKPYFKEINLPELKYCILTAEASYHKILTEWTNCIPNAEIWNLYGPTEATIWCLYYKWENTNLDYKQYNGLIPIGMQLKNVEILVINDKNLPVKKGEKGELCVAGNQITLGYLNNEIRNKEAFFFYNNSRFYKTGDLCFENKEGEMMYCGRIDNQVQIQGFRVELGEVEHYVKNFTKLENVAVIAFENDLGNTEIQLFVEKYEHQVKDISEHLKSKLPPYMVPKIIINLQNFPVNSSNKIDRIALKNLINKGYDKFQ